MEVSTQGIERQEKCEGKRHAAENQNILLTGREAVYPEPKIEVFLKAARLASRTDIPESSDTASADRAAKIQWVEVLEGCAGRNTDFFHPFIRVVDVPAAAALEAVGTRIRALLLLSFHLGDGVHRSCRGLR